MEGFLAGNSCATISEYVSYTKIAIVDVYIPGHKKYLLLIDYMHFLAQSKLHRKDDVVL